MHTGTNNEVRKYIGEEYDTESSLSYLNARYYDGTRGQFESQDPSFLAIGDPKKLQSLTQQDQNQVLMDPQNLNSYSYAGNNPVTKKDPTGQYLEVSASATYIGSGAVGLRFSGSGVNVFASGGVGGGVGGYPISVSYTPGDIDHTVKTSVSAGAEGVYVVGGGVSVGGDSVNSTNGISNAKTQWSVSAGLGADAYARKEISIPILAPKPAGLVLDGGSPNSTPNYKPAPTNKNEVISKPNSTVRPSATPTINLNQAFNIKNLGTIRY